MPKSKKRPHEKNRSFNVVKKGSPFTMPPNPRPLEKPVSKKSSVDTGPNPNEEETQNG